MGPYKYEICELYEHLIVYILTYLALKLFTLIMGCVLLKRTQSQ